MNTVQRYSGKGNYTSPTPQIAASTASTPPRLTIGESTSSLDNPAERWQPFPTQEAHLQVSSLGRVADQRTGELQATSLHPDGYECIWLTRPSNQKPLACSVHWAVAMAFLPNPSGLPFVKHLDANPFNNQVTNLIWSGMPTTDTFSLTFCLPSSHNASTP